MSELGEQLTELVDQLGVIAEQLDGFALDQLREAVAEGAVVRPQSDKRLMQARRAIDRAAHLLASIDEGG